MEVEERMLALSDELDEAQDILTQAEVRYAEAKHHCDLAMAQARLRIMNEERRTTEQQRKDEAFLTCKQEDWALSMADAGVRAARSNVFRIRTQVDIARSLGTSVRSSMEVL
jgi:hypothetical protein